MKFDSEESWPSEPKQPEKIRNLKIQDGGGRRFEKSKISISPQQISGKFCMVMHVGHLDPISQYNFQILKFQDGGRPLFENENHHVYLLSLLKM